MRNSDHFSRDYAASIAISVPTRFWSLFGPSKISQTVLFSRPILLAGGRIAQISLKSNFSQNLGIPQAQERETFLFGVDGGHLALDAAQAAGVAGNDFFFTPVYFAGLYRFSTFASKLSP